MNVSLTLQEKLKDLRMNRGLKLEQLSEQTGISTSSLSSYETDEYKDISLCNLVTLAKLYEVTSDYLLGLTDIKNQANAEIHELHLSDRMIDLLKNKKINARLLCEMAEYPDFVKLLADIEIYVDGVAGMQIQNLNSVVDMARAEIIEKYHPDEYDRTLRTLELAHINEDSYFSGRIQEDMDSIIRGMKRVHKSDSTSAPELTVAQEMQKSMKEINNYHGSVQEKQMIMLLGQLGIDYNKLTQEEFRVLIRVFSKSKHMKSLGSKRGKKRM